MLKLCLPSFALLIGLSAIGLSAVGCSSDTPSQTGGTGGTGGSTGGAGGSGGSRGGASGSGGGTTGDSGVCPKFDYTNYNPSQSPTFAKDIQPIFMISCALASSCHQIGGSHHPYLGLSMSQLDGGKLTDVMVQTIIGEIKDKPSTQVAGRSLAVSGKPEDSYLMNKVEGTNNCSGFTCMGADKCGIQMPDPQSPIEKSSMELIRAWIKKGMAM